MIVRVATVALAALLVVACTAHPPEPETPEPVEPPRTRDTAVVDPLLLLADRVIGAPDTAARRALVDAERERYRSQPDASNLLRLAVARTYGPASPDEQQATRDQLITLLEQTPALTSDQQRMARICLETLEQRQRLQDAIAGLEVKIRSLTDIERSIEDGQREAEAALRERLR